MSKSETLRGVFRTLLWLTKQEFNEMDHKLIKIGAGIKRVGKRIFSSKNPSVGGEITSYSAPSQAKIPKNSLNKDKLKSMRNQIYGN